MEKMIHKVWLLCVGVLWATCGFADTSVDSFTNATAVGNLAGEFRLQQWTVEDGLPQNTINCLLQTSDGYLWIGTREGLVRFDGLKLVVFDHANTPAFRHHDILSLCENPRGCLWIGTKDGLVRYTNYTFAHFGLGDRNEPVAVRSICPRRQGGVWLGTDSMPMHFAGEKKTLYPQYPGYKYEPSGPNEKPCRGVNTVLEDGQGTLWLGDNRGLVKLAPGATNFEVVFEGLPDGVGYWAYGAGRLVADGAGAIWFGNERGLFRHRNGRTELFPAQAHGFDKGIEPIAWNPQDGLWVRSSAGGLSRWQEGQCIHYRPPTGLSGESISCLLRDREGNRWVGTGDGLSRLQPQRVITYTVKDGLAHNGVWSISSGSDGSVWIGTEEGISRYQNSEFVAPYKLAIGDSANRLSSVLVAPSGRIWAGTKWSVFELRTNTFVYCGVPAGRDEVGSQSLFEDRSGALWVGTTEDLFRLKDNRWTRYVPASSTKPGAIPALCHGSVVGVLEDAAGAIWIGTEGGVSRLRGEVCEYFTPANGLPAKQAGPALADADGTVWFFSPQGLIRFKQDRFSLISTRQGLFENRVLHVLEDDFGWLWLNGHRGLQRVRKREAHAVADGITNALRCERFGEADGMLSGEGNGGYSSPNSAKSQDGRLWFPTIKGVVVVDPRKIEENLAPPLVNIQHVVADGEVLLGDGIVQKSEKGHRLPPGRAKTLVIRYTANSFVAPEKMRFQYKLEGHDSEWQEDTDNLRTAFYTNLRPGDYQFRVRALSYHQIPSEGDAGFAFSLAPHFYETWPFYVLCVAGALATGGALHHYRMRNLRRIKELEQLHALDQERARISKDMHDSLGADLTKIAILANMAEVDDAPSQEGHMHKMSLLARSVVDGLGQLVWATNPRHNTLESLAVYLREYASEFLEAAGISSRFEFPAELPTIEISGEVRQNLFLAAKEVINNAVKHAQAGKVIVELAVVDQRVVITIRDNGRGCEVDPPTSGSHHPVSSGNGLRNLKERITAIGGQLRIESSPGQGTVVCLQAPLRSR